MRQPEGFVVPGQEGKVCLMKRSLYGMMQSGRNWAEHLESSLAALGWIRSRADPSIRIRSSNAGTSIIGVYTDDLDGISSSQVAAKEAQDAIKSVYEVTDVFMLAWDPQPIAGGTVDKPVIGPWLDTRNFACF